MVWKMALVDISAVVPIDGQPDENLSLCHALCSCSESRRLLKELSCSLSCCRCLCLRSAFFFYLQLSPMGLAFSDVISLFLSILLLVLAMFLADLYPYDCQGRNFVCAYGAMPEPPRNLLCVAVCIAVFASVLMVYR